MYKHILVTLENSRTDDAIIEHVIALARHCKATVLLIHVADGFVARNIEQLDLRESEEIRKDRQYLDDVAARVAAAGVSVDAVLAIGDPSKEIVGVATREHCDLIAMGTHGHRFVKDLVLGSVANEVRHQSTVPVLLLRTRRDMPTPT